MRRLQRIRQRIDAALSRGHPVRVTQDRGKIDWSLEHGASLAPAQFQRIRDVAHSAIQEDPFSGTRAIDLPMPAAREPIEDHLDALERDSGLKIPLRLSEVNGERCLILPEDVSQEDFELVRASAARVDSPLPPSRRRIKSLVAGLGARAAPMLAARELGSQHFAKEIAEIQAEIARLEAL